MMSRRCWPSRLWWGVLALVFVAAAPDNARNYPWTGWRGPDRTGVSQERGLLRQWPAEGPRLLWKIDGAGIGFSTPSVTETGIYLMGNRDGQECVLACDPQTHGKQLWASIVGPERHSGAGYPGPRSTPTVDGDRVYALGLNGDLVCVDRRSGERLWQRNLMSDFGGEVPTWGYSESVLVDGPWVLCTPGGAEATLVALDKKTGEPVWKSPIGDGAGYSSIVKAQLGGIEQYVQFTGRGVVGVDARDGHLLWRYDAPANGTANCATPIVSGDRVFAASGYGTGGGLAKIEIVGDTLQVDEVYFTRKMKNHHGGVLLVGKHLYGSNDPGVLECLDFATGKEAWADRSCGKGSLVAVDGMLIFRSEEGLVSLVEVTPDEFRLRGRFEQPERSGQPSWPHPVVAGGRLYLRDQDNLLCYDLRGDAGR